MLLTVAVFCKIPVTSLGTIPLIKTTLDSLSCNVPKFKLPFHGNQFNEPSNIYSGFSSITASLSLTPCEYDGPKFDITIV